MARKNKKGTSYCGLGLETEEEQNLIVLLKDDDKSAKTLLRFLVRKYLKENEHKINQLKPKRKNEK